MSWNSCAVVKPTCCNYVQLLVAAFQGRTLRLSQYSTYNILTQSRKYLLPYCYVSVIVYCYICHEKVASILWKVSGLGLFLL